MFTKLFWKDAVERAVSTGAQALAALWGADAVFDILSVNWGDALGVSVGAAVLSLVKAVAANKMVDDSVSPASLATADTRDLY